MIYRLGATAIHPPDPEAHSPIDAPEVIASDSTDAGSQLGGGALSAIIESAGMATQEDIPPDETGIKAANRCLTRLSSSISCVYLSDTHQQQHRATSQDNVSTRGGHGNPSIGLIVGISIVSLINCFGSPSGLTRSSPPAPQPKRQNDSVDEHGMVK